MHARALAPDRDDAPQEDHIVVLQGVTWADYQRLLEVRGDHSSPRIAYREGRLQIMSPSNSHENIKSMIGRLVEVYCEHRSVEFTTVGSWTLEDKALDRGAEPDECWIFGPLAGAVRPDLAVEVVWTAGGMNKLEIYRMLGVKEVWYWRRGAITVHVLDGDAYREQPQSVALAGIDVTELARFLDRPSTSGAMRDYREALRARTP